ncbi:hypothetical protein NW762_013434 [Fusarium torreyae]|uniref:Hydroxyquinol 1,2-dioxygenase n=1 Tax=Fusarium torreyae TaxID=1237075 RepID=A0A9W8RPX2_9HYPO|nr:hypothetical protein NW762_013434 [Fusarium torreyae]
MNDLTIDNITDNVKILNNQCSDARVRYLFDRLVTHIHDFARETRLSTSEWQYGLKFLTAAGQISDDLRAELILLSDTLGLSLLVDAINYPRARNATEGTVSGPFHTHDAPVATNGYVLHDDPAAPQLLVLASVKNTRGAPIPNRPNRDHPDGRAVLESNCDGEFYFVAVVPVSYPIPMDGPVGKMLRLLNRHPNRLGHIHFMLKKAGFEPLVTALYPRGSPYETSDPVFGVKESLIVDLGEADEPLSKVHGVELGSKLLKYEFVLVEETEGSKLREQETERAMREAGIALELVNGLPVLDVD